MSFVLQALLEAVPYNCFVRIFHEGGGAHREIVVVVVFIVDMVVVVLIFVAVHNGFKFGK